MVIWNSGACGSRAGCGKGTCSGCLGCVCGCIGRDGHGGEKNKSGKKQS